jgi:hypothetical protein
MADRFRYLADLLRQAKSANQNDEVGIHQDSTTVEVETQGKLPSFHYRLLKCSA